MGKESLKTEVPTLSSNPQSTHPSLVRTPFFCPSSEQAEGQGRRATHPSQNPWGSCSPAPNRLPALTFLSVMTRFLVPAMQPFSMTKSLLTSP